MQHKNDQVSTELEPPSPFTHLGIPLAFYRTTTILERIAPKMSKSLFTEHANMLPSMAKGTLDYLVGP